MSGLNPTLISALTTVQTQFDLCVNSQKLIFMDVSDCKIGINCHDTSYSLEVARSTTSSHEYEGFIKSYGLIIDGNSQDNYINYINISDCDISNVIVNTLEVNSIQSNGLNICGGYVYYSTPEIPLNSTENILITKQYADQVIQGIKVKKSVDFVTLPGENLDICGNGSNPSNTIVLTTTTLDDISDTSIFKINDRVLVKNQINAIQNGIFIIKYISDPYLDLVRSDDLLHGSIASGVYVFVDGSNSSQYNTSWIQTADVSNVIIGDQSLNFVLFSRAADYKAGNNIHFTDLYINLDNDIVVDSIIGAKGGFTDVSINNLEILHSLIVEDSSHNIFRSGDASINTLHVGDASINNLEILHRLIVEDGSHNIFSR